MQRLEVSGAVRPIYGSLGIKRLMNYTIVYVVCECLGLTKKKSPNICSSFRVAEKLKLYFRVFRSSGFYTGEGKIKRGYGSTNTRNKICSQLNGKTDTPPLNLLWNERWHGCRKLNMTWNSVIMFLLVTVLNKSFNSATLNKHNFVPHPCDRTVSSPQFLNWRWETTVMNSHLLWDLRSAKSWQFILWVITPRSLVGSYSIFRRNVLHPPPGSKTEKLPWHAVVTHTSPARLNQQTTVQLHMHHTDVFTCTDITTGFN